MIADERLPIGVRRVLNVESGLNDGIATPVVTFCIASAATVLGIAAHHDEAGFGALEQLAVGIGVGAGIALVGGRLLTHRPPPRLDGARLASAGDPGVGAAGVPGRRRRSVATRSCRRSSAG